jgi:ribosome-binding factor A
MTEKRVERLNSLLKEVISDVLLRQVKNPHLPPLLTVTEVDISRDLSHAKVHISVLGDNAAKARALDVLRSAAGFIATRASKQVVMRHFPELHFVLDESAEKQQRIDELINKIHLERDNRKIE